MTRLLVIEKGIWEEGEKEGMDNIDWKRGYRKNNNQRIFPR